MTPLKTTRVRDGVYQARFAGRVNWTGRDGRLRGKTVFVWAPADTAEDDCGSGTESIARMIQAKARKRWPAAEYRELWRC